RQRAYDTRDRLAREFEREDRRVSPAPHQKETRPRERERARRTSCFLGAARALKRFALALLCVVVSAAIVPRKLCGRNAEPLFDGELGVQDRLARRVARAVLAEKALHFYQTGSARFDGQSAIAIYQMALLGLGQI